MMQHASPAPALTMMATQNVPPPPYQDSPQAPSFPAPDAAV
ncbi:PKNOX2 isoform 3 [Pan troglodytes]|uniref:PBX/knotted 1 homeobox 2 n=4 Tax=Euarchontoglires TaxID=314146 RepID=E9PQS4_HUMAN|nr:PKNOX2 isoform 3 [Pan troglodytes]PNJ75335.1 PKNOX2 isoform 3 [Pongo abelii]